MGERWVSAELAWKEIKGFRK